MIFIGVDPDLSGAAVLIDGDGGFVAVHDTVSRKVEHGRDYCVDMMLDWVRVVTRNGTVETVAYVEQGGIIGKNGRKSVLKTGYGQGLWCGVLYANAVDVRRVGPRDWQKELLGKVPRGMSKERSLLFCEQTFFGLELVKGKKIFQGRADAACIAEYGRRKYAAK